MAKHLLHSLSNFEELLSSVLKAVQPRVITEVGIEYGGSTLQFLEYAKTNKAKVFLIDPTPRTDIKSKFSQFDDVYEYLCQKSLDALSEANAAELYILDGDHNYWTVSNELRLANHINPNSWIILHDVGFPCDRRDLYYNPQDIPPDEIHEYTFDYGVDAKNNLVYKDGFWGANKFAIAVQQGGEKNGVQTAIDDFLKEKNGQYCYEKTLAIFGLGIIAPIKNHQMLKSIISPYQTKIIEKMEINRMELYIENIKLLKELDFQKRPFLLRTLTSAWRRYVKRVE